jgi:hypothetical protein
MNFYPQAFTQAERENRSGHQNFFRRKFNGRRYFHNLVAKERTDATPNVLETADLEFGIQISLGIRLHFAHRPKQRSFVPQFSPLRKFQQHTWYGCGTEA